jgi:hypothetical protein
LISGYWYDRWVEISAASFCGGYEVMNKLLLPAGMKYFRRLMNDFEKTILIHIAFIVAMPGLFPGK